MKKTRFILCTFAAFAGLTACATSAPTHVNPLQGEWTITAMDGTKVTQDNYRIGFDPNTQRFHAYFGCNRIMGSYQQQQQALQFGRAASTLMMCTNIQVENTGKNSLAAIQTWRLVPHGNGQKLELLDGDQKIRLEATFANP